VKLAAEDKNKAIWAASLGGIALLIAIYQFIPSSSTSASVPAPAVAQPPSTAANAARPSGRRNATASDKKVRAQSLDPTLHLAQLAAAEHIKYEGSNRNIFVSQADTEIPKAVASGAIDDPKKNQVYTPPTAPPPPPIPLKFFGFASGPGEPKKIFLSKGDDVFIAGEGEIVDRRYKVLHISPTSVEVQDVVGSGPPQSLPLVQG
jgi:hypothetical protein